MVDQVRAEHPQEWQLDKYAQQMLDSGKSIAASTPTITTLSGSEFLQKLSASILNSIHLQSVSRQQKDLIAATAAPTATQMDLDIVPNHVAIDSSEFSAMDELQKQLEYDKFMNEVWIGIVFTLILISLVFCICSCFLYHQFRTWKRNFNATVAQSQILDVESMKLNPDHEDPVPNYTLVSGLPSYEAALELLQKKPNARPIVYPSVYSVFNKHEKSCDSLADVVATATTVEQHNQQQRPQMPLNEATRQLMATEAAVKSLLPRESSNDSSSSIPSYAEATATDVTSFSEKSEKRTLAELKSMKNANSPATTKHAETSQKVASFEETG